jgi:hypothetical protein
MPETLSPRHQEQSQVEQERALTGPERQKLLNQLRREVPPKIGAEAFKVYADTAQRELEQKISSAKSFGELADIALADTDDRELDRESAHETAVAGLHEDYAQEARAKGDAAKVERHTQIAEVARTRADALDDEVDSLTQRMP